MTDLYTRITGSRLLIKGQSPYFYIGDHTVISSDTTVNSVNGVTATPFLLWLQQPLVKLNYCDIKTTWWIFEESLLLATLILTCLVPTDLFRQLLTLITASVFFCYSRNWYQHIYSGQYYIIFAFIVSLAVLLSRKKSAVPLVVFPLLSLVRPFFLLAVLPWLLQKSKINSRLPYLLAGIVVSVVFAFASPTMKLISGYSRAMSIYSKEEVGLAQIESFSRNVNASAKMEACVVAAERVMPYRAGCLYPVQHYLQLLHVRLTNPLIFAAILLLAIMVFIKITGYDSITQTNETLLLASFIIYVLAELFTPANRNPYNLIQYLGVLGLLINRGNALSITLLLTGLALNHDFPFRFAYQREAGELLMLISIYALFFIKPNSTAASGQ